VNSVSKVERWNQLLFSSIVRNSESSPDFMMTHTFDPVARSTNSRGRIVEDLMREMKQVKISESLVGGAYDTLKGLNLHAGM